MGVLDGLLPVTLQRVSIRGVDPQVITDALSMLHRARCAVLPVRHPARSRACCLCHTQPMMWPIGMTAAAGTKSPSPLCIFCHRLRSATTMCCLQAPQPGAVLWGVPARPNRGRHLAGPGACSPLLGLPPHVDRQQAASWAAQELMGPDLRTAMADRDPARLKRLRWHHRRALPCPPG